MQRSKPLIFCCQESLPRISLSLTDLHAWTRGLFSSPILVVVFFIFSPDVVVAVRIEEEPRHVLFRIFALEVGGGGVRNEIRINVSSKEHTQGKRFE